MDQFFIVLLGIVLGAGAVWLVMKRRIRELELDLKRTEKEKEEGEKIASGLAGFNRQTQEIKETRKQRILKELEKRGPPSSAQGGLRRASKIQTNETADFLEVSRATAFRYLEELEKEGKIEQIGAFGRNVEYRIKER